MENGPMTPVLAIDLAATFWPSIIRFHWPNLLRFGWPNDERFRHFYPSIEEKAATLLYLIVTNHGFVDGNKRIMLSIYFF